MKIELTPANSKTLTEYAALAGHTPTEFLNQYLAENMVALFKNTKSGALESHHGQTTFEAESCENKGVRWIEATTS
jgi:hypothetical protein